MSFRIDQLAVYNLATVGGSITAGSFVKSGGTSSQFLKADGSVDSNAYITGITSGMVTTALGYTPQNSSTAITTSNIGSQSVSYASSAGNADTVDGLHASSFVRSDVNAVTVQRHLDASTTWTSGILSLFLGWYGGKVVIGNNNNSNHDAASALGSNTIAVTNPLYSFSTFTVNTNANQVAYFQSPNANTWVDIISTAGTWSMGATASNTWAIYQRGAANATRFEVGASSVNTTGTMYAAGYRGNANVAGTGEATYHPAGIYSTGTNWLYGTMYLNNNTIHDAANIYNSGWYRNYGQTGLYNQSYDNHFASYDTTYWRLASGSGLEVWSKGFATVKGYVYFDGSSFGLLNSSGQWAVRTYGGSETQLMWNGSWRGIAQSNGFRVNGNIYTDVDYGYGLVGVYTSTRYQGVFAMGDAYKLPADGTSTGNLYGLAWSHPNAGGVAGNLNDHGLLVLINGGFAAAISSSIRAASDMRAPIFYDSNNTGYYGDFASTSNLNQLTVNYIGVGQGVNTNYRIITSGDYYANAGGNFWAEGRFKQYRGSGTWHDVIDSGNIGSQSVNYASSSGNADTVDGYHETAFVRLAPNSSSPTNGTFAIGSASGRNFIQSHSGQPLDINPLGNSVFINGAQAVTNNSGTWSINITGSAGSATSASYSTYLTGSNYIQRSGTSGNYNTDFSNTPAGSVRHQGDDSNVANSPGGTWWFVDNYRHSNSSSIWGTQIAWGWEDNQNRLAQRNVSGGSWSGWVYYLNSGNYNSYTPTLTGGGASGTWGISITGNANYASSAGNADTLDGYHGSNYLGFNGNSYYQAGTWIQLNGYHGLYAPSWNNAHFYPNNDTYGTWRVAGSRNGYNGITFDASNGNVVLMIGTNSNISGVHNNAYGWHWYWENGTMYVAKNSYGANMATVLDTGNYTNWAIARGGDTVDGVICFRTNNGGYCGSLSNGRMQAYSDSNNSAYMSFHKGGQYAVNMGLDADNVLRIGGWSASSNRWQLDMSGNMTVAGDVTAYSDARVKENVKTVEKALDKTLKMRGVTYTRTDSDDKKTKVGVIAQEMLEVLPEVVNQDNAGMYNVSYGNIVGVLIEAIKEQQAQIEDLKNQITELKENK